MSKTWEHIRALKKGIEKNWMNREESWKQHKNLKMSKFGYVMLGKHCNTNKMGLSVVRPHSRICNR